MAPGAAAPFAPSGATSCLKLPVALWHCATIPRTSFICPAMSASVDFAAPKSFCCAVSATSSSETCWKRSEIWASSCCGTWISPPPPALEVGAFEARPRDWPPPWTLERTSSNKAWCLRKSLSSTSTCRARSSTAFSTFSPGPAPPFASQTFASSNWCPLMASSSLATCSCNSRTLSSKPSSQTATPPVVANAPPPLPPPVINSSRTADVAASEASTRSTASRT
mmetsp:Transcript_130846/g.419614  ORF Transcript_130846/g.419614 Transcript_130846/m.419614 type:complete len:224 (+) Transcript_130846:270-941(+)